MTSDERISGALIAAERARAAGDYRQMIDAGGRLERLGAYEEAWRSLADGSSLHKPSSASEWNGGSISGTLLVYRRMRHIGAELRMAQFVPKCAPFASRIVLWVEPRLVSLFRRSFPAIEVMTRAADTSAMPPCEAAASYERVAQFVARTAEEIGRQFNPLVPSPRTVSAFRTNRATDGCGPIVGISWYSSNHLKDLPDVADWALFTRTLHAYRIASLQYQEEEAGLSALRQASGTAIAGVPVDPMEDIDGFAAAVAAVDVVVSISNTTVHMAGALGKPCVAILDDIDHLIWPSKGQSVPFYPSVRLIRRQSRSWHDVFEQARLEIIALLGHP